MAEGSSAAAHWRVVLFEVDDDLIVPSSFQAIIPDKGVPRVSLGSGQAGTYLPHPRSLCRSWIQKGTLLVFGTGVYLRYMEGSGSCA